MLKIGIIGIHKDEEHGQYSRLGFNYIRAIESTGLAIPYIIPCNTKYINWHIDNCDGFILPGGQDIDPKIYNEENKGTVDSIIENDKILLDFVKKVEQTDKLLFGICRGMQILNTYYGGTMIQHIHNSEIHDSIKDEDHIAHVIHIEQGSILETAFQKTEIDVNSIHHQAIDILGKGIQVIAKSDDGYIEAIKVLGKNILGVQWHPELLTNHKVLFQIIFEQYTKNSLKK